MRKLDWYNLLKNQEKENKASIIKINNNNFDNIDVCERQDDCYFICSCGTEFNKKVRQIIEKTGLYCNECSEEKRQNKTKETNLDKYGVEFTLQNPETREKGKKTMLNNTGFDHPSKVPQIQNKKIEKINNRNKEHPEILAEIQEKIYNKWEQKYGVRHVFQSEEIKKKSTETIREKYGVDNVSQSEEIKQKKINKCMENFGVSFPNQNEEIFNRVIKNSFNKKEYTLPNGNIVKVQGYEPLALDELFSNGYQEDNIIIQFNPIEYEFNNSKHYYFADIFIKNENKIIEVKSTYTMEKDYDKNIAKWEACVNLGYEFEFWIYDNKKDKTILKL